ncbi:unnamed protein product, partial [Amoebophrya sp. A120]
AKAKKNTTGDHRNKPRKEKSVSPSTSRSPSSRKKADIKTAPNRHKRLEAVKDEEERDELVAATKTV